MNVPDLLIEDIFNALVNEGAIAKHDKPLIERTIKRHFEAVLVDAWKVDDIQSRCIDIFNRHLSDSDAIKVMEYLEPHIVEGLGISLEAVDRAIAILAFEEDITLTKISRI